LNGEDAEEVNKLLTFWLKQVRISFTYLEGKHHERIRAGKKVKRKKAKTAEAGKLQRKG